MRKSKKARIRGQHHFLICSVRDGGTYAVRPACLYRCACPCLDLSIMLMLPYLHSTPAAAATSLCAYRTLVERVIGARLVYRHPSMSRLVSFEYLNRQLVWQELSEFLLFLLPLINVTKVRCSTVVGSAHGGCLEKDHGNCSVQSSCCC